MEQLEIRLLGAPNVEVSGRPIEVDTRKATALLAYLAVSGARQGRDALAALFWPEADTTRARGALRRTLSTLNAALGDGWLAIERETVGLRARAGLWVDIDAFRQLARERATLAQAVALFRADFMAGFALRDSPAFDDWQRDQAETLQAELAAALERLLEAQVADGQFEAAIAAARRRLALDALHEPSHQRLMECYARVGQREAALRQYRECARILEQELGVAPLGETTALYEAIRAHRVERVALPAVSTAEREAPATFAFVGRADELATLQRAWERVGPDGMALVLEGEAGAGKTRLAQEFLALVRLRGGIALSARCYEGEASMSYAPVVEALRGADTRDRAWRAGLAPESRLELSRLLPELVPPQPQPQPQPLDSPGAQARFNAALTAALLDAVRGPTPGVIFFDDLQWADAATSELLSYVIRRLAGRPVALLLAWRAEEPALGSRLRSACVDAQHAGRAELLRVGRLGRADATALTVAALGEADAARLAERLYQESEGLPFFLTEYLTALLAGGADAEHSWVESPGVNNLLHSRLAQMSETGRQVLTAAAVIGRAFDVETLRDVSGRGEEETVSALEALLGARLVVELPGNAPTAREAYDFSHARLRSLVYDDTSLARRRLLHRRVADCLARSPHGDAAAGASAAQIAHHFRQAGHEALAASYYRAAGDFARDLYANADAVTHYRAALALLADPLDAAELYEAIGELQTLLGDYGAALHSYREVAARVPTERLPILEHKLAALHHRRGEWRLAESHYRAALDAPHGLTSERRARVLADWSLTAHHAGAQLEAQRLGARALELADAAHDRAALAQAHNLLGVLARSRGDLDAAARHLTESLALAEQVGDMPARIAALNNLALVCFARAEAEQAIELARAALDLCAQRGDRHREAALHNNLADFLHFSGHPDAAMTHLAQAVTLFADIGDNLGVEELQPEIWKLSEW